MNDEIFLKYLCEKREEYGVSQRKLAINLGITREHLNRIENGKVKANSKLKKEILKQLERFNPKEPLFLLIDYFRVRFPTTNYMTIIKNVLRIKPEYMVHEEYAFYGYKEQYNLGNIVVMISSDISRGILVELKGKGCRQMECYLVAQGRSWYDFILDCLETGGIMKRIDIAINDRVGILNIPMLIEKCKNDEIITYFRSYKSYRSSRIKHDDEQEYAGNTLYLGSMQSELFMCIYEKNYEQFIKVGTNINSSEIKNRFEIRLKNDRAYKAVIDLLSYRDIAHTAFSIINQYVRFVDKDTNKPKSQWKINDEWNWFIGKNREKLKLTISPEPYNLNKAMKWLVKQVSPTLKMIQERDRQKNTSVLQEIIDKAELKEKHKHILKIENLNIKDIIYTVSINK